MSRIVIVLALLFTVACGSSRELTGPSPVTVPTKVTAQTVLTTWRSGQPIRVLVVGNSISAEGDPGSGVVAQLRRLVQSKNAASVVENASVSGLTAHKAQMLLEQRNLAPESYDLVLLPLTVNDPNQGVSPEEFAGRLTAVIDHLKARQMVPVLVKENPITNIHESRFGYAYTSYLAAVDTLAAQHGLNVVDGYTPFQAAVVAGGGIEACGLFEAEQYLIHPNQAGHDILFRAYEQWFTR